MLRYLSCLTFLMLATLLPAQQITVTNPVQGAQVPVGSLCTIAWTSEGLAPGTQLTLSVSCAGYSLLPPSSPKKPGNTNGRFPGQAWSAVPARW